MYIDKTEHIHRIVTGGKYFFLSWPRRFGKSLLLSMMKELYSGSRELFKGLWIENNWDWKKQNPVIWLKFSSYAYQTEGLDEAIKKGLLLEAQRLGIELGDANYKNFLQELIIKAASGRKPGRLSFAFRRRCNLPDTHEQSPAASLPNPSLQAPGAGGNGGPAPLSPAHHCRPTLNPRWS